MSREFAPEHAEIQRWIGTEQNNALKRRSRISAANDRPRSRS